MISYDLYLLSAWQLRLEGQDAEMLFAHDTLQFYSDVLLRALTQ
jgi:hypothetical protein